MQEVLRATAVELKTLLVLIVEDDDPSATVTAGALNLFGCAHERVATGEAAVLAAAAKRFDVILMDYHLKGMNGVDATRRIRAEEASAGRPRSIILGLTASVMPDEVSSLRTAGMDDVLTKPLLFPVLRDKLTWWAQQLRSQPDGIQGP